MAQVFSRRSLLAAGAGALALPMFGRPVTAAKPPALVELFTSQGCSSCPPADKLAGELAGRNDVVVVSLNVDYWDYLGWKDTLAKPEFTKRQMDYAHARGDGDVYTPQMVINGAHHVVGSHRERVEKAIESASGLSVPIDVVSNATEITVNIGASDKPADATLWLISIAPNLPVKIERGENSGSTITYHNVARNLSAVGMWSGKAKSLALPRKALVSPGCKSCIAVLQSGNVGPVIGFAQHGLASA